MIKDLRFTLLIWLCVSSATLFAQTTNGTTFGKNRVQFNRQIDEWMLYETPNFITYWYGDARNVAQATLQTAELDYPELQQLLEHQLTDKIEVLVFSDLTDLKQSNIGEDDVFLLQSGETKVVGNKVFVFFDGDHRHLRSQIREGIAGVLINSMLYGANLQEIVQNAVLLNLPGWYVNGLSAFSGQDWNTEMDNQFRDILLTKSFKNFDALAKDHPRLAGQAFWYYISLHYGRGTISNLVYLTRINRSIDAGFLYVLGTGYRTTTSSMLDYFTKRYREEAKMTKGQPETQLIPIKNKKKRPYNHLKISPDGKKLAYVTNDIGKWRVYSYDLETNTRTLVMKGGARNALQTTDYNYPQIAWNPDNQRLGILYERRDVPRVAMIDLQTKKKEVKDLSPDFQRVFSMDFLNPNEMVLSAAIKGISDLFIYRFASKQTERITQDFWDDLDASVTTLDGQRGILFSSNRSSDSLQPQRLDTILPIGNFDIFFYNLNTRSTELQRLTQTPLFDERFPFGTDSSHFSYLSDENGIMNRCDGYLEPYTAYHQAIIYLKDGAEIKALDQTQPMEWPISRTLAFLSPIDSVLKNIDSTKIDSIRTIPIIKKKPISWRSTNLDRDILEQHVSLRSKKIAELTLRNGKHHIYVQNISRTEPITSRWISKYREKSLVDEGLPLPVLPVTPSDTPPVNVPNPKGKKQGNSTQRTLSDTLTQIDPGLLFQVPDYLWATPTDKKGGTVKKPDIQIIEFDTLVPLNAPKVFNTLRPRFEVAKNNAIIRFNPPQIVPYRTKFRTDYISTNMDNNLMFEGLQRYDGPGSQLQTPPPGILLKANFKDLLENYVLEVGFRLPTSFNGMEYYAWFDNKKYRIDRRYVLYRRTTVDNKPRTTPISPNLSPDYQERTNTLMGQYELRYPFDVFTSIRATASLRQDRSVALSSDRFTLERPDIREQRAMLRVSGVYDNTVDVDLNIKTGTRAKVWVEVMKGFSLNTSPKLDLDLKKGFTTIFALDARHYHMLDRKSQLALRASGATSFGSEKMLYILGGVDNWIFPKFNENIPLPAGEGFAFQTLSAHMRGFNQNIRNGNSYMLLNSELRIPIFKYLSKRPVISSFWRNLQLTTFLDAGTAWQGRSPYAGDNPINIVYLYSPPTVTVKVNYFRDPLVVGYGVGLRALLFGMYLRADYAWGIETRVRQKPILHIALGTDF